MAMDRAFTWNNPARDEYNAAQAAAALAGAMPSQAAYNTVTPDSYLRNLKDIDWDEAMNAARVAQTREAEKDAKDILEMQQRQRDYQEYQELLAEKRDLEAKREKFLNSPQMQMAMALARGGQYGALQSMLMTEASGSGGKKKTQADMDALEKSLLTDIYAISGEKDANKRNKLQQMVRLIYGGQMADMLENNPELVSRLGGLEGIEGLLGEQQGIVDDKKQRARWQARYDELMGKRYPTPADKAELASLAKKLGL